MYKPKKCRVCRQEFIPKSSRQLDCNKDIELICPICGKTFIGKCSKNFTTSTCSKECSDKYALKMRIKSASNSIKICKECGKEFHPKRPGQLYCDREHYRKCVVCGKSFKVDLHSGSSSKDIRKTCSDECYHKYMSDNCVFRDDQFRKKALESYQMKTGYDHPMHNPDVISKIQSTVESRYGNSNYRLTDDYAKKTKQSSISTYGTEHPMQCEQVKDKARATTLRRYGVENAMQSQQFVQKLYQNYEAKTGYSHPSHNPEVIEKTKETCRNKFGCDYAVSSEDVRRKSEDTNMKRYGTIHPTQTDEVKQKTADTCLERYGSTSYLSSDEGRLRSIRRMRSTYGVDNYNQTKQSIASKMYDPSKIDEYMKFLDDPHRYIESLGHTPTIHELSIMLGISSAADKVVELNLQSLVKYTLSSMEDELYTFLISIGCDPLTVVRHDRRSIKPYELDVTCNNVSFECNPTSTHNSSVPFYDADQPLSPSYHKMKTDLCEDKNIFLFHIFGYEWTHKRPIIESMIRNILGKCESRIYARKCVVKEVDSKTSSKFLNENHRQGSTNSSVRLGLFYDGELVSLMTFGKMRRTIGTSKNEDLSDCWELIRFCSKLNTSVIGGASKLFKHFVREYHPTRIRSFSDRAHTKGTLYQTLGFNEIRRSDPGYVWVDVRTDIAYHRYNAQKQNIKAFLQDESIDLSMTEREIMESHGFVQVFDSGTITWEWRCIDL